MKRIVRLTESDLTRIVRRVISESPIKGATAAKPGSELKIGAQRDGSIKGFNLNNPDGTTAGILPMGTYTFDYDISWLPFGGDAIFTAGGMKLALPVSQVLSTFQGGQVMKGQEKYHKDAIVIVSPYGLAIKSPGTSKFRGGPEMEFVLPKFDTTKGKMTGKIKFLGYVGGASQPD